AIVRLRVVRAGLATIWRSAASASRLSHISAARSSSRMCDGCAPTHARSAISSSVDRPPRSSRATQNAATSVASGLSCSSIISPQPHQSSAAHRDVFLHRALGDPWVLRPLLLAQIVYRPQDVVLPDPRRALLERLERPRLLLRDRGLELRRSLHERG